MFNHDTWPENEDTLDYGSEQVDVFLNHFQDLLQRQVATITVLDCVR